MISVCASCNPVAAAGGHSNEVRSPKNSRTRPDGSTDATGPGHSGGDGATATRTVTARERTLHVPGPRRSSTRNGERVSSRETEPGSSRPLLIIISESHMLPAELRSRSREVRRWRGGDGSDSFDGDPASPGTYEWMRSAPAVTAVIDLVSADRSRAVLDALRSVRTDAAVLLLSAKLPGVDGPGDGTLVRRGHLRDVLRVDVEEELERRE